MSTVTDDCVTVRASVRTSTRSIDPEFDAIRDVIVAFVVSSNDDGCVDKRKKKKTNKKGGATHASLVLTPAIRAHPRVRSLSGGSVNVVFTGTMSPHHHSFHHNGNTGNGQGGGHHHPPLPLSRRHRSCHVVVGGGGWRGGSGAISPLTHPHRVRRRPSSHTGAPSSMSMSSPPGGARTDDRGDDFDDDSSCDAVEEYDVDDDAMVDVSLEDEHRRGEGGEVRLGGGRQGRQRHDTSSSDLPLPPRHPSPVQIVRASSNTVGEGGGGGSDRHATDGGERDSGGGSSVASLGLTSSHVSSSSGGGRGGGGSMTSSTRNRSLSRSASGSRRRMRGLGAYNAFAQAAAAGGGGGGASSPIPSPLQGHTSFHPNEIPDGVGEGDRSPFPAAVPMTIPLRDVLGVDVDVVGNGGHGGSNRAYHRIFLRTSSHGYVEFGPENSNSHDVFMAFLAAHVPSDRMPGRGDGGDGKVSSERSSERHEQLQQQRERAASPGLGMLRTMVLTPTKEVPINILFRDNAAPAPASDAESGARPMETTRVDPLPRLQTNSATIGMSLSNMSSRSITIDRLQSKVIHQRLRDESTPLTRARDAASAWLSSILDCGLCCMDTTTVAPIDAAMTDGVGAGGGVQRTPNAEALKFQGIGGLSFEIESCSGTPKMSYERSVSSNN